jgi:hypothetical protein
MLSWEREVGGFGMITFYAKLKFTSSLFQLLLPSGLHASLRGQGTQERFSSSVGMLRVRFLARVEISTTMSFDLGTAIYRHDRRGVLLYGGSNDRFGGHLDAGSD